jgi:hypothetical protein
MRAHSEPGTGPRARTRDRPVARLLRRQQLDRDEPIQVHFPGEVHDAHAAAAQLAVDGVPAGERDLERQEQKVDGGRTRCHRARISCHFGYLRLSGPSVIGLR